MSASLVSCRSDGPAAKRQKLNGTASTKKTPGASRIFTPFRTIGLVSSTAVPFTSIPLGKTSFQITTSVGQCLQTYDLKRGLNLVFLTRPQTPHTITATKAWNDCVFAAWGGLTNNDAQGLWVFKRGKRIADFPFPADLQEPIKQILIFGTWIVGCCRTRIEVWKSATYEHYTSLYSAAAPDGGNELTGGVTNMPTYLNKILAGRRDGRVELWNVSSGKLIYTVLPPGPTCGAVTAMQPTPALSLLAIAYAEGQLIIHDIKTDKTVIELHGNLPNSAISSISFRTDDLGAGADGNAPGVMATAGHHTGDVTFWDLNAGGRVMGVLRGAHSPPSQSRGEVGGGINRIEFLTGQPVIVSSGLDNSLKSWIFDERSYSPIPRILHSRSGHAAPVTRLQWLPTNSDGAESEGKWLLAAAKDRSLWGWSLRRDGQSTELSQGNVKKKAKKQGIPANLSIASERSATLEDLKAPEITCLATSLNRDGGMGANAGSGAIWQKGNNGPKKPADATASSLTGWESVVTGHKGDKYARTWFWGRKKAGRWAFETGDGTTVTSVAISPCGTFAVIGSETGGIDMFNLQSGQRRQRYPSRLTPAQAKKFKLQQMQASEAVSTTLKSRTRFQPGTGKHTKAITGIVVDSLNKNVISCSLDGILKFWDFGSGNLVDEVILHPISPITDIRYHQASDLVALTCNDLCIRVIDIETKRNIRELWGCRGSINDFCFSNDGRWIIAASQDCMVRVWDLPTGHVIDAFRMASQCTALAFSGTGEFLATTCEGEVGISVWNNRSLFSHVPTRHISEDEITTIANPTVSGEGGIGLIDGAFEDDREDLNDVISAASLDQISADMMTLSLVHRSRWQTLLHLDIIKQRNKPKEAPKLPEKAPFFLPSLDKSGPQQRKTDDTPTETSVEQSRIMKMDRQASEGEFTVSLQQGSETGDYAQFLGHLSYLPPSAADLEIRSLSPAANELVHFVEALISRLREKRDYELVQAWMAVFLRLHGDELAGSEELKDVVKEWRKSHEEEGRRVGELVGFCSGVVGFLRGGT